MIAGLWAESAQADFGFQQVGLAYEEADGSPATQAGSHPFSITTSVMLDTVGSGLEKAADGSIRRLRIDLPPGLVAMPRLLPMCSQTRFIRNTCPETSALGTVGILARAPEPPKYFPVLIQSPMYNLEPLPGSGAELGIHPTADRLSTTMRVRLGISGKGSAPPFVELTDIPQTVSIIGVRIVLWGDPGNPAHDPYRGSCGSSFSVGAESFEALSAGSCPLGQDPGPPLLSLPPSCPASSARFEATAWSGARGVASAETAPLSGCADLWFAPTFHAALTSENASAPAGLELGLDLGDDGLLAPDGNAGADASGVEVELPEGVAVNPPVARGLEYCTPEQIAREGLGDNALEGCPAAAKIGSAELTSPLIEGAMEGSVYLAGTPSPDGRLPVGGRFDFYLVFKEPERGLLVVQRFSVDADRRTGRLTARTAEVPQLPIEHLEVRLDSTAEAPLATPAACGGHDLAYRLEPSSGGRPAAGTQSLPIEDNCQTAFNPSLSYQLGSPAAGSAGSLALQLSLTSHEAGPVAIDVTLPKGLAPALGSVAICPEATAATAACPSDSRIGHVGTAVGAGADPLWLPGGAGTESDVFLAGPYGGAPYSLVIGIAARSGVFDVGTVVIRAPVTVDPWTGQVMVRLEGIPQILAGIPLRYRELRIVLDRPALLRMPTSCSPLRLEGFATASDGERSRLGERLRTSGCAGLGFRPALTMGFFGALNRNGHPGLRAVISEGPGEANLAAATITLPRGELLDLHHLPALCARGLPPGRCPSASALGGISLSTPLIPKPLRGAIYLRQPKRGLPDLLADLHGAGVHLLLVGHSSAVGPRVRLSFPALPDLPISKGVITLAGGRRGVLVNSGSLCGRRLRASVLLKAQNGRQRHLRPSLGLPRPGCTRFSPENESFASH